MPARRPAGDYGLSHDLTSGLRLVVRNESDWWVYNEIFVDGDYDGAIDMAFEKVQPDSSSLFIDVGANVGYFTARILDKALRAGIGLERLRVVMIEGSPTVFEDLTSRYDSDTMKPGANVCLVHGLAGHRSGVAEIAETAFGARNTLQPEHNAGFSDVESMIRHQVPFLDLMSLVEPASQVALLKCDIEGSEQALIETYADDLLPMVQVAIFELHHKLCDVDRCYELLAGAGLRPVATPCETSDTSLVVFSRDN